MTDPIERAGIILCLISLATLLLIPLAGSDYLVDVTTEILIYSLFALSLNVIIGYSGNVSFGHAAYFAIGGYTNAILLTTYAWPLLHSLLARITLTMFITGIVAYF